MHASVVALDSLTSTDYELSEGERASAQKSVLAEVRRRLPPHETVEWPGGALEVDNTALHAAVDEYERNSPANDAERVASLSRLVERLAALDERLAEVEAATASGVRDKEAERRRLDSILLRPEYKRTQPKKNALSQLVEQVKKWVQDLFPDQQPIAGAPSPRLSRAAQVLIYTLALVIVGFLLWRYGARLFRWRDGARRRRRDALREPRIVLGELLQPDQSASDLLAAAEQLARDGDVRGAIRKAYIALLCELGDRRLIRLAQHKTNRDYLNALRERAPLYSEMRPLTLNFEKHWYGLEAATPEDWTDFRTRCRQALNAA